jgi:hypothetical protein
VIAPKCGLVWDDPAEGRVTNRLTAASIEKEADDSLKRLGIESRGSRDEPWKVEDRGEKPAIALKGR